MLKLPCILGLIFLSGIGQALAPPDVTSLDGRGTYQRPNPPDAFVAGCIVAYLTQNVAPVAGSLSITVLQTSPTQAAIVVRFTSDDLTCVVERICPGIGNSLDGWQSPAPCVSGESLEGRWTLLPTDAGYHFDEVIATVLFEDEYLNGDVVAH